MSPEQISWLFLAIIAAIPIVLLILWLKARARASSTGAELIDIKLNASKLGTEKAKLIEALEGLERRFRPVIDADEELANVKEQHRAAMAELETLRELAKNANARLYLGFDRNGLGFDGSEARKNRT